jgi:beta-glucosidase
MPELPPELPPSFRWGVATASYQIEGAVTEDGRGPSIWDTFSHTDDKVADGDTGDVACDHYHRYGEDVALMAELGVGAYRFSIAWPRVQPTGTGPANGAGLAFYDRLVDALLERGIEPVATLYHWDLPQALQDDRPDGAPGGWQNRDTAHRFADYAAVVAGALGDRVKGWITLNEPSIHTVYGHLWGLHAPGLNLFDNPFPVIHHQLLGHGLAVAALRAHTSSPVSIANNFQPAWAVGADGRPETASEADRAAAAAFDVMHNWLFTDPLLRGAYPDLSAFAWADRMGETIRDGDLAVISAPIDGLGVNFYNPAGVGEASWSPLPYDMRLLDGYPMTYFGWPVVPDSLRQLLVSLRSRYGASLPPIDITENGACYQDLPGADGSIVDSERIAYLDSHTRAMAAAVAEGVDVRSYFAWSLMDNFEWAEGYSKRFGLVHVDFETLTRTPKASFGWYRDLIAGRGE